MKTTQQKRDELRRLLNGKISLESLKWAEVESLLISGPIDQPQYWIDHQKVSQDAYNQCIEALEKFRHLLCIDWSHNDRFDRRTWVTDIDENAG